MKLLPDIARARAFSIRRFYDRRRRRKPSPSKPDPNNTAVMGSGTSLDPADGDDPESSEAVLMEDGAVPEKKSVMQTTSISSPSPSAASPSPGAVVEVISRVISSMFVKSASPKTASPMKSSIRKVFSPVVPSWVKLDTPAISPDSSAEITSISISTSPPICPTSIMRAQASSTGSQVKSKSSNPKRKPSGEPWRI